MNNTSKINLDLSWSEFLNLIDFKITTINKNKDNNTKIAILLTYQERLIDFYKNFYDCYKNQEMKEQYNNYYKKLEKEINFLFSLQPRTF